MSCRSKGRRLCFGAPARDVINLSAYDALDLRVRGDGRRYKLNLRVSDDFDGVVYQAAFETRAGTWMTTELHLAEFGAALPRPACVRDARPRPRDEPGANHSRNRQAGPFRLEVSSIAAANGTRRGESVYSGLMRRDDAISTLRGFLPELRGELTYRVRRLALFGSTARDEARDDSDLDVLVDFEVGPTFDLFMGLKLFLEDHIGRKVNLVTPDALKPRMRPVVEREAVDVA